MMLTTQTMASSPIHADDLWNLKIIFGFHDKVREMEIPTLFSSIQIEELKNVLWKWRFQG